MEVYSVPYLKKNSNKVEIAIWKSHYISFRNPWNEILR